MTGSGKILRRCLAVFLAASMILGSGSVPALATERTDSSNEWESPDEGVLSDEPEEGSEEEAFFDGKECAADDENAERVSVPSEDTESIDEEDAAATEEDEPVAEYDMPVTQEDAAVTQEEISPEESGFDPGSGITEDPDGSRIEETTLTEEEEGSEDAAKELIVYDQYTITFDPCGGFVDPTSFQTTWAEEGKLWAVPEPWREGYTFAGWYSEAEGGVPITKNTVFTSDTTIYAHWMVCNALVMGDHTEGTILGTQRSNIWFGNYEQSLKEEDEGENEGAGEDETPSFNIDPIKWRVLKNEDGKALLLADQILDVMPFYPVSYASGIQWHCSTLRSWLNGYGPTENACGADYSNESFKKRAFTSEELEAVPVTEFPIYPLNGGLSVSSVNDRIFVLTYFDAKNIDYGFSQYTGDRNVGRLTDNTDYAQSIRDSLGFSDSKHWWLCTPGIEAYSGTSVATTGMLDDWTDHHFQVGVRPSINISLESVLFASAATGGKTSGPAGSGALRRIGKNRNTEWKLTLLDDGSEHSVGNGHADFSARLDMGEDEVIAPGEEIRIGYRNAPAGQNEYVSVILCDPDDKPVYYGRIARHRWPSAAPGGGNPFETASFLLPEDLSDGEYTLKVFAEEYNGDKKTDYASAMISLPIRVSGSTSSWGEIPKEIARTLFHNDDTLVPEGVWYAFRASDGLSWRADAEQTSAVYTGKARNIKNDFVVFHGKRRLFEKKDYTVKYVNHKTAAAFDSEKPPTITIRGKGKYRSSASFTFNIVPESIRAATMDTESIIRADAGKKLGSVSPKLKFNGKKLKKNSDYTFIYYEGSEETEENRIEDPSKVVMEDGKTYLLHLKGIGNFSDHKPAAVTVRAVGKNNKKIVPVSRLKITNAKGKKVSLSAPYDGGTIDLAEYFDNSDGKIPKVQVRDGSTVLQYGTDYTVTFADEDDGRYVGKHTVVLRGNEEKVIAPEDTSAKLYMGTKKLAFSITGTDMKKVKIAGLKKSVAYNGVTFQFEDAFNPKDKNLQEGWDTVTLYTVGKNKKKTALTEGADYTVTVANIEGASYAKLYVYPVERYETDESGKEVKTTSWIVRRSRGGGLYEITFEGRGGVTGTIKKKVKIDPYDLTEPKVPDYAKKVSITVDDSKATVRKSGAMPEVTVTWQGMVLREGVDYKLSYKNNKKAVPDHTKLKAKARPAVTVTGRGRFKGKYTAYFNIARSELDKCVILDPSDVVYKAKGKKGYFLAKPVFTDGGTKLKTGRNKDVEPIASSACVYTYAEDDTTLKDGTVKNAGDPVLATDKVLPGTKIRLTVKAFCSEKSGYVSEGEGTEFTATYRVIDSMHNLGAAKAAFNETGKTKFVYSNCEPVTVTESDMDVRIGATKKKPGTQLDPATDYEIVSITNNRLFGTAVFTVRGKGEYGGMKKFRLKMNPRSVEKPE
ncbi:MAG: InlB B-repeat-containing protein [Lachnospiraceae bacterium]|nr:InlB B-repeat-containing protein [Lachnospiraceae bacterium]